MTGRHTGTGGGFDGADDVVAGLLGVGAVLWVLAQLWPLTNVDDLRWLDPADSLFFSGQPAVCVLLAGAGFVVTRQLLARRERGPLALVGTALRLGLDLAVVTALGFAAVTLVVGLDNADDTPWTTLRELTGPLASFQWNLWLLDHPLAGRSDLVPMWPFSVVMQMLGLVTLAVLLVGRWRPVALLALGAAAAASLVWQATTLRTPPPDQVGWFVASLHTYSTASSFLLGGTAAALAHWRPASRPGAGAWVGAGLLALTAVVLAGGFVGVDDQVGAIGPLAAGATALAALGATAGRREGDLAVTALTSREVAGTGRAWMSLLALAPVVVTTVARHLTDTAAVLRVGLALIVLAMVTLLAERIRRQLTGWVADRVAGRFNGGAGAPGDGKPRRSRSPESTAL